MNSFQLRRFRTLLLGTKTPENIGSFARLLENFGVEEAGLVAPRCDWKDGVATWMATGPSLNRLHSLPVYSALSDAVSDCHAVVGFTARAGRTRKLTVKLDQLASELPGKVALVFGREDICLLDSEVEQCTHLCALDTNPDFPTLNVSHSVAVVLASLYRQEHNSRRGHFQGIPVAELEPMYEQLRDVLVHLGYEGSGNPERVLRHFKSIFGRAQLHKDELSTIRGFLTKVRN